MPFYGLYKGLGALLLAMIIMFLLTANSFVAPCLERLVNPMQEKLRSFTKKERLFLLIAVLIFFAAVYMPSYWATGTLPPGRTQTILYILPIILWVPLLSVIRLSVKMQGPTKMLPRYNYLSTTGSILAILIIVSFMNIKNVFLDALWRGEHYDQQLQHRYEVISNAKNDGEKEIVVPELNDIPKSLFFGDILTDSSHWRNQCYSRYFGLRSIRVGS